MAKPAGPTSHDVVERVRRVHGCKAGHTGSLDPFATGLLVVLIGRATREQNALMGLDKQYRASVRLGVRSTTGDPEGELHPTGRAAIESEVRAALPAFAGDIEQRAPMHSAVKVDGERLYRKARRGEQVATPVRHVRVDGIELLGFDGERAELAIRCSKGTYVRQLVTDLGDAVGAGAYCERLERTAVGPFRIEDAATLEEVEEEPEITSLSAWLPLTIRIGDLDLCP